MAEDINRSTTIALPPDVSSEIMQKTQQESAIMRLSRQISLPGNGVTIPVMVFFTLAAKDPNEHLDNMQQLMQIFTNEPLLDALMEANTPEDILAAEAKYPPEEDY